MRFALSEHNGVKFEFTPGYPHGVPTSLQGLIILQRILPTSFWELQDVQSYMVGLKHLDFAARVDVCPICNPFWHV